MEFKELSSFLQKLESTPSRNSMIEILSELFSKAKASDIDKIIYLLQGRVVPLYVQIEFGMADRMMLKAIAAAYNEDKTKVNKLFSKEGDLGKVCEVLGKEKGFKGQNLTVTQVFDELKKAAESGGGGSVEVKVRVIAELLKKLDPLSSRFVARIPVGRMRLGFSDMTVLDSLSWVVKKDKSLRPEIERAFNIRPDLGFIAKAIKEHGIEGLAKIKPEVFTPILMARAERLSSGEEILKKIGRAAIEPKIDGFRLQVHFDGKIVKLITRNLEDSTFMYPDIVEGIKKQVKVKDVIFEGEAIAYNPDTEEFLPFQETVQRKRKYNISEKAKQIPLKLICFDLLYLNGKNFIGMPYIERRNQLEKIIVKGETLILSQEKIAEDAKEINNDFEDAVSKGLEGIMAKRLEGTYQAGARGWNWIKLKRSYSGTLQDTIDCLIMGYYTGQGKRTAFGIGAFLIGIYNAQKDVFETIAKIGTGLTDDEWRELYKRCQKIKTEKKPALYEVDKMLEVDYWVEPSIIVEVRADEITRSPVHTAGRIMKASKSGKAFDVDTPGYALRFPRLERFRDDKKPDNATTLKEIEEMFKNQKKQKMK